jgi:integrase
MSLLYDPHGNRKYLTLAERHAFLTAARRFPPEQESFCQVLGYTGGRISEVLALTFGRIDLDRRVIVLETLKKRRTGVFREIPVPVTLLADLDRVHGIGAAQRDPLRRGGHLWGFGRTKAWMIVKQAMATAAIDTPRASPKALRHSFAVAALQAGVPITLVRKWLGHSRITTTEIYTNVVGDEEQQLASLLWREFEKSLPDQSVKDTAA